MRVVRAFRIPITAIITALALSGCMRTTGPVAVAPQGDLDSMAYGQANSPPPQAVAVVSGNIEGKTQTATLRVQDAYENFNQSGAYGISLVLAAISVVVLVTMTLLRPKEEEAL